MTPRRFQLSRTPGYRMPDGGVSVARPGRFGNPFYPSRVPGVGFVIACPARGAHAVQSYIHRYTPARGHFNTYSEALAACLDAYRDYISRRLTPEDVTALKGRPLGCWCKPDQPCHADVLLRLIHGGWA